MEHIYLDHNATAPCCDEAVEALLPFLGRLAGNALSGHTPGRLAAEAVERARTSVARLTGGAPRGIVFGGGGTEALNQAVKGLAFAAGPHGPRRLLIGATEHHAVEDSARWLGAFGFALEVLPVDGRGLLRLDALDDALDRGPALLVAVMHANNEVGTVQPVEDIGRRCRAAGAFFVCDAVQSAGKIPVDAAAIHADLLAVAAHKFYGPKGVGALWVRDGVPVAPLLHGARHEEGRRAGTHNTAGIVGMGVAAEIALSRLPVEAPRLAALRDRLEAGLLAAVPGAAVNGGDGPRLPNTSNVSFEGILAQDLLPALDRRGVAASAGAACRAGVPVPSPTLLAMGLSEARALGGVRFSLGHASTPALVDDALSRIRDAVLDVRGR